MPRSRFAREDLPELNSPTIAMRKGRANWASMDLRALMTPGGLTSAAPSSFSRASLSSPVSRSRTGSHPLPTAEDLPRGALRAAADVGERMIGRSPLFLVTSAGSDPRLFGLPVTSAAFPTCKLSCHECVGKEYKNGILDSEAHFPQRIPAPQRTAIAAPAATAARANELR